VLFIPEDHEQLTDAAWDEARVRGAIETIVADAEAAFDEQSLWPPHPLDEPVDVFDRFSVYLGAAGILFALDRLADRDWSSVAVQVVERFTATPDSDDERSGHIPSLLGGEAGILLVAHGFAPSSSYEERLLDAVHRNRSNPTWELLWGSPGTMLAAQVMYERTGDERWAGAWRDSAERLWEEWRGDLWSQEIGTWQAHVLGPAHGFAGNVLVLARGNLLDAERRSQLERRTIDVLAKYAWREDGLVQWTPSLEERDNPAKIRTQWCHGAPGIVTSLAGVGSNDDEFTKLLVAAGELTWRAGPLVKGASLCHGTAGNGFAFLKLFERTGDELWLDRARRFAMHAIEQIERARTTYGQGRYSLFTGDVGSALYLLGCCTTDAAFPLLDAANIGR
jgi:lantibiotic modifying enzyme